MYQFFERINMVLKRLSALFGCHIARVGLFADELLFYHNIILTLECFGMACQVTIGHAQQLFERIKIGILIYHEYRHDTQAYAVVKRFINMLQYIFQLLLFVFVLKVHYRTIQYVAYAKTQCPEL